MIVIVQMAYAASSVPNFWNYEVIIMLVVFKQNKERTERMQKPAADKNVTSMLEFRLRVQKTSWKFR